MARKLLKTSGGEGEKGAVWWLISRKRTWASGEAKTRESIQVECYVSLLSFRGGKRPQGGGGKGGKKLYDGPMRRVKSRG